VLTSLLISSHGQDGAPLLILATEPGLGESARWSVFHALAWFASEGSVDRAAVTAALTRFEAESIDPPAALSWIGWEDTVTLLGLTELEPALRRAWTKAAFVGHREQDRAYALECLATAATGPLDRDRFALHHISPVGDPVEKLAWIDAGPIELPESGASVDGAHGYVVAQGLGDDELLWLSGFLASRQVPETTMSMEMLDGFFTGLIAGPDAVPPSHYMASIWGNEEGVAYEGIEQANLVLGLFQRHWNGIASAMMEGLVDPLVDRHGAEKPGLDWCEGFLFALDFHPSLAPTSKLARRAIGHMEPIIELHEGAMTRAKRLQRIDELGDHAVACARIWRPTAIAGTSYPEPVRVTKVGRNDPCPCGSGAKYKKCCGASGSPPPTRH
jgi:uncharacterized protein